MSLLRLSAFKNHLVTKAVVPHHVQRFLSYSAASAERIEKAKEAATKRPLSPHITIWRWEFPMLCSLAHRGTGFFLSGAFAFVGLSMLFVDPETFLRWVKSFLHPSLLFLLKFGIVYSVTYHLMNGVRHMTWDVGKLLKVTSIYKSGYFVMAGAFLISLCSIYWFDERDVSEFMTNNKKSSQH
ncbi:Succinate dehydrogenase cytochrome b560 subunit [Thelohanellus kitauei]|uniref:Succinate dehydrogenase cytochrome b560 subunit n=1 Tax=Thelohanellus kitauei TaxID=669202 RepID=A0A0C2MPB3_THEKT|nr:Succinate dehydrogenase cytochrome b560 subunit [Thelohanellus kitauei]